MSTIKTDKSEDKRQQSSFLMMSGSVEPDHAGSLDEKDLILMHDVAMSEEVRVNLKRLDNVTPG